MQFIQTLQDHQGEFIRVHTETGAYLGSGLDKCPKAEKAHSLLVDNFTASGVLDLHRKLNDANRTRLEGMKPAVACNLLYKMLERNR